MSEINVTPLVDVMLVLLIIFMVTAPLMLAGVPVELPDSRAEAVTQDDAPIAISLSASGDIFIGEDAVPPVLLPDRLATIAGVDRANPPQIMLRADKALDYGSVMRVMGELNRAGLNRVSLITTAAPQDR